MVGANAGGDANDDDERIADCTQSSELSGNGMETIHCSEGYASGQRTDDHDRHVRIESAIGVLMEFNIGRT